MMNYKFYILSCVLLAIQGCVTSTSSKVNLQDYLQQFIGQSAQQIQQNLDLKSLGYQVLDQPSITEKQLTYTILRPMNIPTPIVSNVDIGGNAIPLQLGNYSANSYDVNFNCKIIFNLNHQIAESIQYQGKAC
ncbi:MULTISPECIES: hypothetical protein [unclassified Acinetobacter]|uniref:hypothetical protein n=1 Tax=unclassified Acinetobacter TaxID=196816 RepID=UPI0019098D2D|nr:MULTISPECIES: hypothetical protein [unclassified Acinetobacter]MBK0062727.1 hypothetical protein [Acinetobacter sp. S55]MBK0065696.1 hypothetical protein [Acinetobacter sp. S54]